MKDVMKNIQYRSPKEKVAGWQIPTYGDWTPFEVTENYKEYTFPSHTQFRLKPVIKFEVHLPDGSVGTFGDKDNAMFRVAELIDEGCKVTVQRVECSRLRPIQQELEGKNVQWRTADKWHPITTFNAQGYEFPVRLRVRPDYYHTVRTINTLGSMPVTSFIDFTDIEDLAKYVDNRIRTNGFDFSVVKVNYAS
jgi:hypothetical protein